MYPIITIGRQFGSGGYDIAKQLADQLGWKLFDRETLLTCAEEDDSIQELETFLDEKPLDSLLYAIVAQSGSREVVAKAGFDAVRQILAKQLGISPHQLSYVTHSGEGEGLLFYGSTILPFVDHFPKNTELYRIMTTKPLDLKKEDEQHDKERN